MVYVKSVVNISCIVAKSGFQARVTDVTSRLITVRLLTVPGSIII